MSIKNIVISIFAIAALSSFAMAQGGQPNQKPQDGGGQRREGMGGRGGGGMMGRGEGMGGPGMGMRGPGMMDFSRLNLTDDQKQKIQAIQDSAKTSREANKTQMEEMGKLMQLKREGLLTTQQGTRLTALEAQMQTQMKAGMEKMQNDIMAILTADQKTLLEQQKKGRDEKGRGNRGPGQPGGPGEQGGQGMQGAPPSPNEN